MPLKIKIAAVGLAVALTGIISWANSDALYTFYLKSWYGTIRGMHASDAADHALSIRHDYESLLEKTRKKDAREELTAVFESEYEQYLTTMIRVFASDEKLPSEMGEDEKELSRLAGVWYLEKGDVTKGAGYILRTVGNRVGREDVVPFTRALDAMYDAKMYSDIAAVCGGRTFPLEDQKSALLLSVYFRHGVSLYYLKRYKESLAELENARFAGYADDECDYYTAASLLELRRYGDGIVYAKKALDASPRDRRYRVLLVCLYNAAGQVKDAEKISRGK
ncbi:MAG: hypothetical protein ACRCUT_05930 [Spirochaetota bacterium]